MDDLGVVIAFWALAAMTIGAAAMLILVRNLMHAILFLILSFVGVAGLYITLSADFVAVAQVLIYAGAISVLMIFAVMLTPLSERDNSGNFLQLPALVLSGLVIAGVTFVALETEWREAGRGSFDTTAAEIGEALLSPFVLPFEIASVLLVAAMIGAIVIVRDD
ncbi:MAG: NADH-quinone oxidoreductase subunit J [Chloroflexi bacterium]|nr:NADH-quinone oxidoreductase subunit J [Chloroflexota bacterium]